MNCNTKMKKIIMYQNEHSDKMVFFTDFNINPILLFSKKFTHAQLKNKLKSHSILVFTPSHWLTLSDWLRAYPSFRAFHRPKHPLIGQFLIIALRAPHWLICHLIGQYLIIVLLPSNCLIHLLFNHSIFKTLLLAKMPFH